MSLALILLVWEEICAHRAGVRLCSVASRFIGTGIQYCFTRNLHVFSTNFYFSYFVRVVTGALGCVFVCLSVNHFGRRGMLLLSAIITGLASLLLLALTQCTFASTSSARVACVAGDRRRTNADLLFLAVCQTCTRAWCWCSPS